MINVRKKDGETSSSLFYRFSKKIQHSGVLREAKKRQFHKRNENRLKRKLSAIYKFEKKKEVEKNKKMGLI